MTEAPATEYIHNAQHISLTAECYMRLHRNFVSCDACDFVAPHFKLDTEMHSFVALLLLSSDWVLVCCMHLYIYIYIYT